MWRSYVSSAVPADIAERISDCRLTQAEVDAGNADLDLERADALERIEDHILACARGERRDLNRDGTTRVLDMAHEIACRMVDHAGLEDLVRRVAQAKKDGDWQAVTDQASDIIDDCVRQIAEDRLPYDLQRYT